MLMYREGKSFVNFIKTDASMIIGALFFGWRQRSTNPRLAETSFPPSPKIRVLFFFLLSCSLCNSSYKIILRCSVQNCSQIYDLSFDINKNNCCLEKNFFFLVYMGEGCCYLLIDCYLFCINAWSYRCKLFLFPCVGFAAVSKRFFRLIVDLMSFFSMQQSVMLPSTLAAWRVFAILCSVFWS